MWERYLKYASFLAFKNGPLKQPFIECLNSQLVLSNFVKFLLEPEQVKEWGWIECPKCHGKGWYVSHLETIATDCHCSGGKSLHPTYSFAHKEGLLDAT